MRLEEAAVLLGKQQQQLFQETGKNQIGSTKAAVIKKYSAIFAPENIPMLTAGEFRGFLLFKNNQHWKGLFHCARATADMGLLRQALAVLVDDVKPLRQRLDQLRPPVGEPMVKGLARAVITAILQVRYPDRYGVVNSTTEEGMTTLGIELRFPPKASFGERYEAINARLLQLAGLIPTDLWTLDILWTRVQPQVPPDDDEPSAAVNPTPASDIYSAAFALESHLQEFLVENWAQTALGGEWDLLENKDGDLIGSYYNTHAVGEIDLLARHKTEQRWLVVELKRNQTSDATVGQLLRYRSWVREHLAAPGYIVEGIIICPDADVKLKYAIKGLCNIGCMTYQISFSLESAELTTPKAEDTFA
jgi:hypothetical protein